MMHAVRTPLLRHLAWLAPLIVTLSACDPSNSPTRNLTISTTTPTGPAEIRGGASGGSLTLSAAQVVLRKVELAREESSCDVEEPDTLPELMTTDGREGEHGGDRDGDKDDDDKDCEEVKVGPLTVDLPLDTMTALVLDALVPAGTYVGVRVKLDAVKVSGTYTDTSDVSHPFDFTSRGHATIRIKFPAPITLGPSTSNVTITVDVASWFKNRNGAVLDPADPANAETISRNVRRSFKAFGDNNHDGKDDHRGHDGDDDDHDGKDGGHGPG